jgi:2-polyprenyl-3-methyl-5-hydroxy-6-metoxy-1,4-benzoquinol methylase
MTKMQQPSASSSREERWAKETEYFDAVEYERAPLHALTIERYRQCQRPWFSAEYPFWAMGDVTGKHILDIGCGDGTRSILLGLKGARVLGVDLSPRAVEAANHRARLHGVDDRVEFICCPLEQFTPKQNFDIIVGWNILHHLIPELTGFLANIQRFGNPGCLYVFYEPVNLSPALRRVRLSLPVPVAGTPDERPLEQPELDIVGHAFSRVDIVYFGFFVRLLSRYVLRNGSYELSSRLRRFAHECFGRLDYVLIRKLGFSKLASTAAILCRVR